jgi:hypothetical protein
MRRAAYAVFGLVSLASLAACGSSGGTSTGPAPTQGPSCDPCDTSSGQETTPVAKNPDGVPYPTKGVGWKVRGTDGSGNVLSKPGDVMKNLKWMGFPNADSSKGLQEIQLADYFDPTQKRDKVIHLIVSAVWCGPCNAETDAIMSVYPQLQQMGVAMIQMLTDSAVAGTPASVNDLNAWITKHGTKFNEALDPQQLTLGPYFDQPAIPLNVFIDARSMEIIDRYEGAVQDQVADAQVYVDWVNSHPATQY